MSIPISIPMRLPFALTGARNTEISRQLGNWARQDKRGVAFGSSTGWKLPGGAKRSADASWMTKDRIKSLDPAAAAGFWNACPDFVIELRSRTDRYRVLREKMDEWLATGARLGWLIDPESRSVEVYRPGRETELRTNLMSIEGEGPVAGFVLDLTSVWEPLPD